MVPAYNQLIKDLQKRAFACVYLFHGEEPFFIDELSGYLEANMLNEMEKEFNQTILYGRDTQAVMAVNYCKQFPMVGNQQLIVVREAQDMDFKKDESIQALLAYFNQPSPSSILVLAFKYKKAPAPFIKLLSAAANAVVYESKRIKESELNNWILNQVNNKGYTITGKACTMLAEFLGNNLEKIVNELSKLFINHHKNQQITEEVIEKYIGISKDYNTFELINAIANKNIIKTNKIIHYFALNPKENSIFKTIPMLFGFFSKLLLIHSLPDKSEANITANAKLNYYSKPDYIVGYRNYSPNRIIEIISWIRECNIRAIGVENYSVDEGELLRELVFKILN